MRSRACGASPRARWPRNSSNGRQKGFSEGQYGSDCVYAPLLTIRTGQLRIQNGYALNYADSKCSGGLSDTGNVSTGCCDPNKRGQIYARAVQHKGKFVIMYASYVPKD